MNKIKILLIEDNRLLRDGIVSMLSKQKDISILAASGNKENTILKLQQLIPEVILLDLGLRNQNSLTIVEIIKKDFPAAKIIVMDLSPVEGDIIQFVKAGASGFILKDASLDDFLGKIRSVAEGGKVLPPNLINSLFSQIIEQALQKGKANLKDAVRMTKREREVITLIADGMTNKEIGKKLHISDYTVKSHVHNIMEKLTLHTRLEVANYSFSGGTIQAIAKDMSIVIK
jgi:RNA polymerase sigma factor (sigma-70 family)